MLDQLIINVNAEVRFESRATFFRFFLIIRLVQPADANVEISLGEALQRGQKDSPVIAKAQSFAQEGAWRKVEARATYYPTLSLGVNYLTNKKYVFTDITLNGALVSIPQILATTTYSANANYLVFEGLSGFHRLRSASARQAEAEHALNYEALKTEREIILHFYRALAAKNLERVANKNLVALQDHLKEAQLFKRTGISTNYDVLRMEVQVSEAESEYLIAQDNIEIAKSRLAEALGTTELSEPTGVLPVLTKEVIDHLDPDVIPQREDILATKAHERSALFAYRAEQGHWFPKVNLFGTWLWYNNRNDQIYDRPNLRDAYQMGVTLSWSVFNGFANVARAHESFEQNVQAEKDAEIANLKAKKDFEYWRRRYIYNCTVYQSRLEDVARSQETVRLAREGLRVGARTNTDLLDAANELYRAQAAAVNAQVGSIEALVQLELTVGKRLYSFQP